MKACRQWENTIVEYADEVCEPEAARRLEVHLAHCEACAQAVRQQKWIKHALTQVDTEHAPAYLARRIRDHARSALRRRTLARLIVRLSFAVTAVGVAVVALWWNASRQPLPPAPPTDESALAQAIVQEYIGTTAGGGFSDPSLQMLAREAQMKTLRMEPTWQ